MNEFFKDLKEADIDIYNAINSELERQRGNIELIASENFVSKAVLAAMGTCLTNKYAEGYPGKRYYGGCEKVDIAENLAIERAKKLFGAEHANVQPHSGAQANTAVFFAELNPGDTIMGMNLSHGGHLTHGSPVNISGKHYNIIPYGVDKDTGYIDYNELRTLALQHRPKMIIAGASAYPREIDFAKFAEIAAEAESCLMVDMAHIAGLVAVGRHSNPIPHADYVTSTTHKTLRGPRGGLILCRSKKAKAVDKAIFPGIQGGPLMHIIAAKAVAFKEALDDSYKQYIDQVIANAKALANALTVRGIELVSGGTDNHLMLIDLRNKNLTGKEAEKYLDEIGITCNKNTIPFDQQSPLVTSGLRLGTPAVTTRGMKEADMEEIADIISMVLEDHVKNKTEASQRVMRLCSGYSLY